MILKKLSLAVAGAAVVLSATQVAADTHQAALEAIPAAVPMNACNAFPVSSDDEGLIANFSRSPEQLYMWPPNHKFHRIVIEGHYEANNPVGETAEAQENGTRCNVRIVGVSHNEISDAGSEFRGTGNTDGDVRNKCDGGPDASIELRAERAGAPVEIGGELVKTGRLYRISVEMEHAAAVPDRSADRTEDILVLVPHDMGNRQATDAQLERAGSRAVPTDVATLSCDNASGPATQPPGQGGGKGNKPK